MQVTSRVTRATAGLVAIAYTSVSILQHDWAQQFVRTVQQDPTATWVVMLVGVIALLTLAFFSVRSLGQHEPNVFLAIGWIMTGIMVCLSHIVLMSVHTEAVHFLQFGLLAPIVFLATKRVPLTLALVTIAGLADEAYQYWFLYANWGIYLDWNDVVLNAIAGGLGLLALETIRPASIRYTDSVSGRADLFTVFLLAGLIGGGALVGLVALHPDASSSSAVILLDRTVPREVFWQRAWWSGKFYHQLSAWNALFLILIVSSFYRWIIKRIAYARPA
jgi:hypothetical protein